MIHSHVVIDGSNLATEGRTQPSLRQLREAVDAFAAEHPSAKLTVVVDATFGHRIDPSEVAEFDAAVSANEVVAPPAGAIGRGDAFVLGIADKVSAAVLSNDSYQEFHGQYAWLFDEGRLVGGKPVPHVGWVFVYRSPVRGPLSRKSVSEAKRKGRRNTGPTAAESGDGSVRVGSAAASMPMPVPTAPPPGKAAPKAGTAAKRARGAAAKDAGPAMDARPAKGVRPAKGAAAAQPTTATGATTPAAHGPLNDFADYMAFVEHHRVGSSVSATVDHYSSHGAYVRIGEVWGYVPLRLMADPPPRSARALMKVGDTVTLVVHEYVASKRSIDLALPGAVAVGRRAGAARSAASTDGLRKVAGAATAAESKKSAAAAVPSKAAKKPASKQAGAKQAGAKQAGAKQAGAKQAGAKQAGAKQAGAKPAAPKQSAAKKTARKSVPKAAAKKSTPTSAPAKNAAKKTAKKAVSKSAPAKRTTSSR